MKFNEWLTMLAFGRQQGGRNWKRISQLQDFTTFYPEQIKTMLRGGHKLEASSLSCEQQWHLDRRPYYDVYPGIIELLLRLKLDFPVEQLTTPVDDIGTILVRLPANNNPMSFAFDGKSHHLRAALVGFGYSAESRENVLQIWFDIGEFGIGGRPVYTMRTLVCHADRSVEDAINAGQRHISADVGIQIPLEFQVKALKLICSLLLLADDDRIIEPDVLSEDRSKYDGTHDRKYVERAVRRGKIGWSIGKHIEMIPHYRRPHMALFWTGKGRTIPKIGLRKGAVVKRTVVGEVPTGYLDDKTQPEPEANSAD
jgi:hypothetical protein